MLEQMSRGGPQVQVAHITTATALADEQKEQFDRHLEQNGWKDTRIEFFFNHKKRYRWFGWDGDEDNHQHFTTFHVRRWFGSTTPNDYTDFEVNQEVPIREYFSAKGYEFRRTHGRRGSSGRAYCGTGPFH